jgi:hypothetical protein
MEGPGPCGPDGFAPPAEAGLGDQAELAGAGDGFGAVGRAELAAEDRVLTRSGWQSQAGMSPP